VNTSINGIYSLEITSAESENGNTAFLIFHDGRVHGSDDVGVKYSGRFNSASEGFTVQLQLLAPQEAQLSESLIIEFFLPEDFLLKPYVPIDTKNGPLHLRFDKLGEPASDLIFDPQHPIYTTSSGSVFIV